ncbi:hypothetical protein ACHHYP_15412 [Achlya hypogyna]|uniref:Uncharacterized protein n=1 Tax=Achlya hypogyna TaxID=1202772 RepID=A0A1V9ZEW7_ACHHY|nr:hypothetical protein ACHHYP_15412 [Achlya hypogyna]
MQRTLPALQHSQSLAALPEASSPPRLVHSHSNWVLPTPSSLSSLPGISPSPTLTPYTKKPLAKQSRRTLAPLNHETRPLSPTKLLSKKADESQDSEFQSLLRAANVLLELKDVEAATAKTLELLVHVENKHYASLHLRQEHVAALQGVERALEALEADTEAQRLTHRHRGNQHMQELAAALLAPAIDGRDDPRIVSLIEITAAEYKRAGDKRHECIAALTTFAEGGISNALALAAEAAVAYEGYKASPHFAQCQLLLSLGFQDVTWSHEGHQEVYAMLNEQVAATDLAAFLHQGQQLMQGALDASKASLASDDPDAALAHLHRCKVYRSWLEEKQGSVSLPASVVASLEKKFTKAKLLHKVGHLLELNDYQLGQVIVLWQTAAVDEENATMLMAEMAIAQLAEAAIARPACIASFIALLDTILTTTRHDQEYLPDALKWLVGALEKASGTKTKLVCLERFVSWVPARPLLHHVVGKGRFVSLWLADRDEHLGDDALMLGYVRVWAHFQSLHPKALLDDNRSISILTAVWMRHVSKLDIALLCLDVATVCIGNGLRTAQTTIVASVVAMLQTYSSLSVATLKQVVMLLEPLAADKSCLIKCRHHRDVLLPRLLGVDCALSLYDAIASDTGSIRALPADGNR